jgi:transposase-like protein
MAVLTDLKNRGVKDIFFVVCDGLKGLPDSVNAVFPLAIVQACIIHLIRGTFRYASKRYWEAIAKDLKPIYTAVNAAAAEEALAYLEKKWGKAYPAIPRLWRAGWEQFIPFLDYDVEIRRVLRSTNAIESLNARYRRTVTTKGHFPTEQAPSRRCTWSPAPWTPRAPDRHDGSPGGSPRSTRSPSPSPTVCPQPRTSNSMNASYTVLRTDPVGLSAVHGWRRL